MITEEQLRGLKFWSLDGRSWFRDFAEHSVILREDGVVDIDNAGAYEHYRIVCSGIATIDELKSKFAELHENLDKMP
jgi:hypothetical protein